MVFIAGGVIGVLATRSSLIADIDDQLRSSAENIATLNSAFPAEFEDFARESAGQRAVIFLDADDETVIDRGASRDAQQLGRPNLTTEQVLARPGESFTVDAVEGDAPFRVFVHVIDGGGHLALCLLYTSPKPTRPY